LVVSFLVESTLTTVESFLVESTLTESVLTESVEVAPLPLQAAKEVAIAKAKKPILNEFFIFNKVFLFEILSLIPTNKKGNPYFLKKNINSTDLID